MNQLITDAIFPACHFVESRIVGQRDPAVCSWWARKNAFRHAVTIASIVEHAKSINGRSIRILNMSGLSCGHQDFSICEYLGKIGVTVDYHAIEHPNSPYLAMPEFQDKVNEYHIQTLLCDLKEVDAAKIKQATGEPDVILFTEIAEHLEHADLLRSFQILAELLGKDAYLILTTPNFDSFDYRIQHLLGREVSYWGDGYANLQAALFGHIVYYNIPRLRRLMNDAGLNMVRARTFNFPEVHPSLTGLGKTAARIKLRLLDLGIALGEKSWRLPGLMNASKTLGELLYIEARSGKRIEIPFAL